MAHDVQRPHDKLFRTVFSDHAEAAALLRAHLPESLAGDLRWSTLTLQDRTFVDPDLRDTESDLLFSIRRKAGAPPAWLYVLLEHQSRPDRWIRFRLLKYCCRIWDRSRQQFPRERRLRPIVPLVFYQGPGRWRHATEFAELFADPVRDWPWVPRFAHLLVDQSRENPQAVRGRLHGPYRAAHDDGSVPASAAGAAARGAVAGRVSAARRPGCRPYAGGVRVGDTRPRHRAPIRSTVARDGVGNGR